MGKSNDVAEMNRISLVKSSIRPSEVEIKEVREALHKAFRTEHGALKAFAKKKGITQEWLRLVFIGQYNDMDLLIEAADFLKELKDSKMNEVSQKHTVLTQKVLSLA